MSPIRFTGNSSPALRLEGLSLSDYLLREMKRIAEAPTLAELEQRLSQAAPVNPGIPVERIIREERDAR
jgi:hypothetical protein